MQIHHLRSATFVLELESSGEHVLIDPMLGAVRSLPGFDVLRQGLGNRNPTVELPDAAEAALDKVTAVLLTHLHPDHLDRAGAAFARDRGLPVYAHHADVRALRRKGLDLRPLGRGEPFLGGTAEAVPTRHGHGVLGWLMGRGVGWLLRFADEGSLYLTGDTVWTGAVRDTLVERRPDVVVAPAGGAWFGVGRPILLDLDEVVELVGHAPGEVVLNHLEALDHCGTSRAELRARLAAAGLSAHVPADGEVVRLRGDAPSVPSRHAPPVV